MLLRFVQLNAGLMLMGFSIAIMLGSRIGLGPLEVFNQGLGLQTGLTLGRTTQLSGLAVVALTWLCLRVAPGVGTLFNMALVGLWIDLFSAFALIPVATNLVWAVAQFELAVVLFALATAFYISANLGAGPFDNLMLAIEGRSGWKVGRIRTGIEVALLGCGFLLGGSVGLGTLLFAATVGPLVGVFLTWLRRIYPVVPAR